MTGCLLAAALLLACGGDGPAGAAVAPAAWAAQVDRPALNAPPADAWLAEDKAQHFTLSFAATTMAYGAGRTVLEAEPARIAAGATAAALGIGKEILDARAGRGFSVKDLVWDAAGVALGMALIQRIR